MTAVSSPATAQRTPARWPVQLLRAATTGVAVLVLMQAALAGSFLSGGFEALAAHARNGGLAGLLLVVQTIAAIVCARMGLANRQPVLASVVQLVIVGVLFPLGEQRILVAHVPLAVLLTVGVLQTTYIAWLRTPMEPEGSR
ncbi:hypothetical protein IU501_15045 [Nocardia otitidiscaviarum]|uniref:hypothetical protein n=1 Tax=Nocardia otitidiscaviarum TaxID=1823 RepID=UPI00069449FA|nr:hypothetical protein [Nocardia otitidiscaviarum]MBF6134312.1 hypothetical protein [Nocardia otitidiscaviarum]MBF6484025.1 hypothetical protein [Nocardia otitidiscaviarum]